MTTEWFVLILGCLGAAGIGFIWIVVAIDRLRNSGPAQAHSLQDSYLDQAHEDIDHFFNEEFREELRNRGRMQFQKIIDENAMFLKQDLDMTVSQLNDYLKKEIVSRLNAEFAAYAKAMQEAQELTLGSLQKTAEDVNAQHAAMTEALKKDVEERKAMLIKSFEDAMGQVVEHYLVQALGDQFDLKAQLPYIIKQMESIKGDMIEDMKL